VSAPSRLSPRSSHKHCRALEVYISSCLFGGESLRGYTVKRQQPASIVTTSWDDGDGADLRLCELLESSGIKATFYIPIIRHARSLLNSQQLRTLSYSGFEIGAHGCSHRLLTGMPRNELAHEIVSSKSALEDVLAAPVKMFCYPSGAYDASAIEVVKQAGFAGARTTRMLATTIYFSRFEMPTSLQSFPHGPSTYLRNLMRRTTLHRLVTYSFHKEHCDNWVELGKHLFDSVLKHGGVWHLYGHSWEIDELGLWQQLKDLFDYVHNKPAVQYLTNSEVLFLTDNHRISGRPL